MSVILASCCAELHQDTVVTGAYADREQQMTDHTTCHTSYGPMSLLGTNATAKQLLD